MTQYYIADLSGTNPDYLLLNMPTTVFRVGQVITFPQTAIFASSLRMVLTDGSEYELIKDVDYTEDAVDDVAMAIAFTEQPDFEGSLIRSVTITSQRALNKRIAMSYQQFFSTTTNTNFDDGLPVEITPEVIKYLWTSLADCRQQLAKVKSPVAVTNTTPALLPFDINGVLPSNLVTGEVIAVNTAIGAKTIRLAKGAFFADSLKLSYAGKTLSVANGDYLPIGASASLTARSTNRSGVYQYILLNGNFTGDIHVDAYRAVGGEVQLDDVRAIYDLQVAISDFLNTGTFVTSQTITQTPSFRAFNARLNSLETNVRNLLTGTPTFGDSTGGTDVLRAIKTLDANHHWWTIANLYQVEGSTDIVEADQFRGRVFFPGANIAFAFTVDFNLAQTRNPVSFTTESLVFDPTYTLFGDLSVHAPIYPMLRVVWNQAAQGFSGASLQIGLPVPALSDQMTVEDLSTNQSCWILDKTGSFVTGSQLIDPQQPKDNGFTLPDGVSVWSSSSNISLSKVYVPKFEDGYLAYAGSSVVLNQLTADASTGPLFQVVLPKSFPVGNIRQVVVTMQSADTNTVYDVVIPVTGSTAGQRKGRTAFIDSAKEAAMMSVALNQDVLGSMAMSLNVSDSPIATTAGQGVGQTDVVRYVRVRV